MLVAVIYLAVILFFIYRNGCFGLFRDENISQRQFTAFFFLKALAIPACYLVYARFYGGLESYDAGVFYSDAKAVNAFAHSDPLYYLQLLFGLQNDSEGSYVYNHCLIYTYDWDNGKVRDFFYNDNRVVIRLHSMIHFVAFGSYYIHALFSCFISFIGLTYLYRAFKGFFKGRGKALLGIFCFFPTLWFYTGAISKESLALFVLGCSAYQLKATIYDRFTYKRIIYLVFLLFMACILKPYLLWPGIFCFTSLFALCRFKIRYKIPVFLGLVFGVSFAANGLLLLTKHRSLATVAVGRQHTFSDAAKGGIFLIDDRRFIRLDYDSSLIKPRRSGYYSIRKGVGFIYWEHSHQQDTLFCLSNPDTLSAYKLVYKLPQSGSNFELSVYSGGTAKLIASCFYYSLFYPFFYNARGILQLVASFENLLLLSSLIIALLGLSRKSAARFPAVVFIIFALGLCLLVGLTTPNSGAIFRYRAPAAIFLVAAALYYLKPRAEKTI